MGLALGGRNGAFRDTASSIHDVGLVLAQAMVVDGSAGQMSVEGRL
jgi:hypothetical protein